MQQIYNRSTVRQEHMTPDPSGSSDREARGTLVDILWLPPIKSLLNTEHVLK